MPKPVKLRSADRHYVARFTYGPNRRVAGQVRDAGGGRAWFDRQLRPGKIRDGRGSEIDSWYPALTLSPRTLLDRADRDIQESFELTQDLARWTILRRTYSDRQLHEIMVEFWSNLLNVPIGTDNPSWMFRPSYDRVIRKYALKRFDKMLKKTITHGAMGLYLDNAFSTKEYLNENLGREVLELHSVGVGKYDESDVLDSARLLTGYRVDPFPDARRHYDDSAHYTGRVRIMDFRHPNRKADGRKATRKYLRYLAHHPATARRIAHRLCVRFVSDEPSRDLVRTVARAYTRSGTKIAPTLRAMVDHPEFMGSKRAKVRMPLEDSIATIRAMDATITKPEGEGHFVGYLLSALGGNGQTPFNWPTPDGYPEHSAAWANAGQFLNSMTMHRGLALFGSGRAGVEFPEHTYWIPRTSPCSFKKACHRASRLLHGTKAPKSVRKGISIRTGIGQKEQVTSEQLTPTVVLQMILTLLDSPNQLNR
ncbi:MAG: DUF1800 domain-containing protein [Nocardioides sp.]